MTHDVVAGLKNVVTEANLVWIHLSLPDGSQEIDPNLAAATDYIMTDAGQNSGTEYLMTVTNLVLVVNLVAVATVMKLTEVNPSMIHFDLVLYNSNRMSDPVTRDEFGIVVLKMQTLHETVKEVSIDDVVESVDDA